MMLFIVGIAAALVAAVAGYFIGKKGAEPKVVELRSNLENALKQVESERRRTDELVSIERSRATEQLETARCNAAEQLEAERKNASEQIEQLKRHAAEQLALAKEAHGRTVQEAARIRRMTEGLRCCI